MKKTLLTLTIFSFFSNISLAKAQVNVSETNRTESKSKTISNIKYKLDSKNEKEIKNCFTKQGNKNNNAKILAKIKIKNISNISAIDQCSKTNKKIEVKNLEIIKDQLENTHLATNSNSQINDSNIEKITSNKNKLKDSNSSTNNYSQEKTNKTQGHYIGFDAVLNRASFNQYYSDPDGGINYEKKVNPSSTGYGGGLGINYKYAFNFNKFFIAPGIFYEKLNTKVTPSQKAYPFNELSSRGLTINDRYGIITNFGYDFNQNISPYLVIGYSAVRYNSTNGVGYIGEEAVETVLKSDTAHSLLYGLGLNLKYNQQISFNLEYNMQKFTVKQGKISDPVFITYNSKYKAYIDSLKLGVDFNF